MIDNELQVRLLHAAKDRTGWKQASSRPKLGEVCLESSVDPNNSLGLVFKIKIGDNHRKFCRYIGSSEVIPPPLTPEEDWDFTSSEVLPYFGTVVTASGTPQVFSLYKYPDDYSVIGLRGKTVARIYQLTLCATESAGETTIALGINQNSYKEIRPGNNITFTGNAETVPSSTILEISADFNSLDVSDIALAEWRNPDPQVTGDTGAIRIYKIKEVDGKISKSTDFIEINVSSPLSVSYNTTTGVATIGIQDGTTSQKGAVQLLDTYTTGDGGNAKDNTKATTNKAITAAISSLDSQAPTLDDTTSSLDIINTVTEINGIVSSTKKTILAGNKINLVVPTGEDTNAGKIIINHDTVASPTVTQGTQDIPSSYTEGEKETLVITDVTTDGYGHITSYKSEASTNLIAADIKAPVTKTDNSTWNFRETGGDITIGEDTAKIPVLEGNTIVWNQLITDSVTRPIYGSDSNITITFPNQHTTRVTVSGVISSNVNIGYQTLYYQQGHRYIVCVNTTAPLSYDGRNGCYFYYAQNNVTTKKHTYVNASTTESFDSYLHIGTTLSAGTYDFIILFFDLTKMFGETIANSMTVEEFERLFTMEYAPYCEGRLVNLGGYGVKWNQLYDTTVPTAETDHKYYLSEVVSSTKTSSISTTISYTSGSTNRMCIDLTMMFSPGSEPTLEEFEAMFPKDYYDYNAGTEMNIFDAIGNKKLGLESTGFNQWDEEWESGVYSVSTGQKRNISGYIRCANFIPVLPKEEYYIKVGSTYSDFTLLYYDINRNFISYTQDGANRTHTIPANVFYITFYINHSTYNNDICINLSSSSNGTYEPYKKDTLDLDWIHEIEYTQSGSSTPEKLFPYGLLSAGSVYDEVTETKVIKRVGVVDLGVYSWLNDTTTYDGITYHAKYTVPGDVKPFIEPAPNVGNIICPKYFSMPWYQVDHPVSQEYSYDKICGVDGAGKIWVYDSQYNNSTIADFKDAMSGVMLYYELATPIEIPLAETHRMSYVVADHGTEQQLPVNVSSVINAPFRGTFEYLSNFKDAIRDLFNQVNNTRNHVKGINDTPQTNGKLAVYDSDHTVKSSDYSVLPSGSNPFVGSTTSILLPTAEQIITYVNGVVASTLTYKGIVSTWDELPTSGQSNGDLWIASAVITHDGNTYYPGTFFIWNSEDSTVTPAIPAHWDIVTSNTSVSNNDPYLWGGTPITPPSGQTWDGKKYEVGTINGTSLTVRVPELPNIAGKQTSGNVLVGNGTGENNNTASWRGLKLDETVNNDTNNTPIGGANGTSTGVLVRSNNGQLTNNYQWEFGDPSAISLINPTNSSATSGKVLVGNYTSGTPAAPSWRNLKLDELSYNGTNLIPNLGTGFLKRTGTDSWSLTNDTLTWKDETNSPTYTEVTQSTTDKGLTNFIHSYSGVTTIELGSYGTSSNVTKDGFRINIPLLTSNNATVGKVLKGTKTTGVTTLPTWDNLSLEELSEVLDSAGASGYLKRVDNGESATDRYTWEFDPYGGSGVMPYKSNSDGNGDVATSSKTTAEINLLPTAGEKVLARTALREQVGTNSYVYHKISVGALENDSNIVLVLNGNFS